MSIDLETILPIILTLIAVLEGLKKLIESTVGKWILQKIFHWEEIPSWLNFLIVNVLGCLILLQQYLGDSILTWDEVIQLLEVLIGANGLFLMYRGVKDKIDIMYRAMKEKIEKLLQKEKLG